MKARHPPAVMEEKKDRERGLSVLSVQHGWCGFPGNSFDRLEAAFRRRGTSLAVRIGVDLGCRELIRSGFQEILHEVMEKCISVP